MSTEVGGDGAVRLLTLSQTNTVAAYVPAASGVQDNAGLNDCPADSEPVIHASETVTPLESCTYYHCQVTLTRWIRRWISPLTER